MPRVHRILMAAVAAIACIGARSQSADPAVAAVVEQAGRYVTAYVEAFSAVVCAETQEQRLVRANRTVKQVRTLNSDFLLVKTDASPWPVVFRDVIAVDGKPVRNRQDRLRKLFLDNPKTAVELARAIAKESERHDIGVRRTGSSPLLPLIFLTPAVASGVRFTLNGSALTFQEVRSPSVLARRTSGRRIDMMSHGSFEIEPHTSRILAADFTADAPPGMQSASFFVRYDKDSTLDLSVPIEMTERYWPADRPGDDRLEARSTYSAFRKFQVSTTEQIKVPK